MHCLPLQSLPLTRRTSILQLILFETLLCFINNTETAFALADKIIQYLSSIVNRGLTVEALRLASSTDTQQLNAMQIEVDYTEAKQNATQSHKKLTKVHGQRFSEKQDR